MEEKYSHDWWLWQMYRLVAEYINDPTVANESKLQSMIAEFRSHHRQQALGSTATVGMAEYRESVLDCG